MKKKNTNKSLPVFLTVLIICLTVSAGIAGDSSSKGNDIQMDMSLFDYDKYVYIDADAVAKECGAAQDGSDPLTKTKWSGEVLRKVLEKIKPELHGNKLVAVMGHMPCWVLAALA